MKRLLLFAAGIIMGLNVHGQKKTSTAAELEKFTPIFSPQQYSKGGVLTTAAAFFTEEFDGGPQADWAVIDSISPPNGEIWQWSDTIAPFVITAGTDSFSTNGTTAANGYMIFNSDGYGNNSTDENTSLVSPPINCSMYSTVYLGFNHYYRNFSTSAATVFVSNDSITWTQVALFNSTAQAK